MRKSSHSGLTHYFFVQLEEALKKMKDISSAFLATEKVGKLMKKYAIPCIISLLVGALYNIVDQIFIANADYLGSYGNAANTVVFPLTVIALAVAVMIGDGCCAFVSICLGKNRPQGASKSVGNSILLIIILSMALMAIYLVFANQILAMLGGTVNAETFKNSQEYFLSLIHILQRSAVRVGERIAVHLPALGEFHHPFAPGAGSVHHVDISRGRR